MVRVWRNGWLLWSAIALTACDGASSTGEGEIDLALPDVDVADVGRADGGADAAIDATLSPPDAAPADAGADAYVPVRPDELWLEGEPILSGPEDLTEPVGAGVARAGRVDDESERLTGPEANCRVGCFRLDNARVSFCVQGERTFSPLSGSGGNLIDAHLADRPGTDLLREVLHAPELGEVAVARVGIVRDGADGGEAVVRIEGRAEGSRVIQGLLPGRFVPVDMRVVTEYRLAPDAAEIDVLTWIEADRSGGGLLMADFVLFGDRTRGFAPPASSYLAAEGDRVSYAWFDDTGDMTVVNLPFDQAPLSPTMHGRVFLRLGDIYLYKRRFRVGTGDVESVRPVPDGAEVTVIHALAGARIQIDDADGQIVTRVQIGDSGEAHAKLLVGAYTARALDWPGGPTSPQPFEVSADGGEVSLTLPEPGRLRIRVSDPEGRGLAARVRLRGWEERLAFVLDEEEINLAAGEWTVTTTRGWHYTADERTIQVTAGQATAEVVVLEEVIPPDGWAAGEFHQHASPSLDSTVPVEARVLSNLAEGVSFMVGSDHDFVFDYRALAERMGVLDRIAVPLSGVEISPLVTHVGAYGIPYDPDLPGGGAPPIAIKEEGTWRAMRIPEIVHDARQRGARVIQINHPHASQGYFDHVHYDPEVAIEDLDPLHFTADFDTIEVFNGRARFCQVLADWLGLLGQGLRVTAIGNSDTHEATTPPGYPRNYVPTAATDPVGVTENEVVDALLGGHVVVGGGAVLDLPEGPLPGEDVEIRDGTLSLRVRVRTPPYARIHRLIVFHNRTVVVDHPLETTADEIVDLDAVIDVPVGRDGPVVLLALGDGSLPFVAEGEPVFALANPIWVDTDGDGVAPIGPGPIDLPSMNICQ